VCEKVLNGYGEQGHCQRDGEYLSEERVSYERREGRRCEERREEARIA
jgi:hypothetical protein